MKKYEVRLLDGTEHAVSAAEFAIQGVFVVFRGENMAMVAAFSGWQSVEPAPVEPPAAA